MEDEDLMVKKERRKEDTEVTLACQGLEQVRRRELQSPGNTGASVGAETHSL